MKVETLSNGQVSSQEERYLIMLFTAIDSLQICKHTFSFLQRRQGPGLRPL